MRKQDSRVAFGLVSICLWIVQLQGRIQDSQEEGAGGGGGGRQPIRPNFLENCMKTKNLDRGHPKLYYVDPPLNFHRWTSSLTIFDLEMTLTLI